MKRLIIAAAILATSASLAQAKCSKPNLNGNWVLYTGVSGAEVAMTGGTITIGGTELKVSSFGSKCTGFGLYTTGGATIITTITSESVSSASPLKPNQLTFSVNAGAVYQNISLFRR